MKKAKVFWSGRSQAVRLPKEYRLDAREVQIKRQGDGILLQPLPDSWDWLDKIARPLDQDFVIAIQEEPEIIERPGLDKLFRS